MRRGHTGMLHLTNAHASVLLDYFCIVFCFRFACMFCFIFVFSLPYILFIMCTGDSLFKEYAEKGAMILTRLKSKRKWFIQNIIDVSILSSIFLLILFVSSALTNRMFGHNLQLDYWLEMIVLFVLMFLFFIVFSLLSNIVCFVTKSGLGYVVVITMFFLSMFTTAFIHEWFSDYLNIITWLPTSHLVITWHDNFAQSQSSEIGTNFSIWFSVVYLLIALLGSCAWLYKVIKRHETL